MNILSGTDTYDKALNTVRDLASVEKYWDQNSKEVNLHDLKTLVKDQAVTSYRTAHRETLKMVEAFIEEIERCWQGGEFDDIRIAKEDWEELKSTLNQSGEE